MAPSIKEAFPKDPEQWIYNKADEFNKQLSINDKEEIVYRASGVRPEEQSDALFNLALENYCLKLAIKSFNELYTKFKENQK